MEIFGLIFVVFVFWCGEHLGWTQTGWLLLGLFLLEFVVLNIFPRVLKLLLHLMLTLRSGRPLSENERMLRRASRPVGIAVVAIVAAVILRPHFLRNLSTVFLADPVHYWLPAVLLGAAIAFGVASLVNALRLCPNMRDGAASRAAFRLVTGAALSIWLWLLPQWTQFTAAQWQFFVLFGALLVAVWTATIGSVRLVVLLVDGGNPLRVAARMARDRNDRMRPGHRS